jgi:hypothetical protein
MWVLWELWVKLWLTTKWHLTILIFMRTCSQDPILINYILCSQSPHNSTDHVVTKCRCFKRCESNCDSSQNNIYLFCYGNMFLEFLITPHCAHSHLTALLVRHSSNAGAMRVMSQIMTHHKVTIILFFYGNVFSKFLTWINRIFSLQI